MPGLAGFLYHMTSPAKKSYGQPVILCVAANHWQRARIARRLDGYGVLLTFPDFESARTVLFADWSPSDPVGPPASGAPAGGGVPAYGVDERDDIGHLSQLVVDHARQQIRWAGRVLPLTRLEREVFAALAHPPLRVWTYAQLYEQVWEVGYFNNPSAVRSTVKRLRVKLRQAQVPVAVESVRGVGFSLLDQTARSSPGKN